MDADTLNAGHCNTANAKMASDTTSEKASNDLMSMTLLVDTKAQRALYAEVRKDVVDFLFSLLALPVASAVKLLGKNSMVGCVGNLYVTDTSGTKCPNCQYQMRTACRYVAGGPDKNTQNAAADGAKGAGFVQGIVTYTVMDDLTVAPMSSISSITLLNKFAVDLDALKERTVQLGYTEGLAILKASLQSKTVLTDVFISLKR